MDTGYDILEEYHRDNAAFIRKYGHKPYETIPDDAPHDCVNEAFFYMESLKKDFPNIEEFDRIKCPKCNNMVYFDKLKSPNPLFTFRQCRVVQTGNYKTDEIIKTNE